MMEISQNNNTTGVSPDDHRPLNNKTSYLASPDPSPETSSPGWSCWGRPRPPPTCPWWSPPRPPAGWGWGRRPPAPAAATPWGSAGPGGPCPGWETGAESPEIFLIRAMWSSVVLCGPVRLPGERAGETSVTETGIDFASFGLC